MELVTFDEYIKRAGISQGELCRQIGIKPQNYIRHKKNRAILLRKDKAPTVIKLDGKVIDPKKVLPEKVQRLFPF